MNDDSKKTSRKVVETTKLRSRLKNIVEQANPDLLMKMAVDHGVRIPPVLLSEATHARKQK